jgi:hypothetical protein
MRPVETPYLGLDRAAFWQQMERCFAAALAAGDAGPRPELDEALVPQIVLDPPPTDWPNPEDYLNDED